MPQDRLKELLGKLLNNNCTPQEKQELLLLVKQTEDDEALQKILEESWNGYDNPLYAVEENKAKAILQKILGNENVIEMQPRKAHPILWRVAAAAAVIILFFTGIYLWMKPISKPQTAKANVKKQTPQDIMPGGDRAILTLADGSTIILDSARNGLIGEQGKTSILKTSDGQLAYNSAEAKPTEALFNTVATPKGGQYMLTLSDGTKVWLNAASSLHFPAQFSGTERRVALTGEAYFEVVHDAQHPFIVNANDIEVHDLGTEFNINAYYNEPVIQTTLVSGSAEVKAGNESAKLTPGKAAIVNGATIKNEEVDVASVTAWKNGLFQFNNTDLKTIMRQIERWYDVEMVYEGNIPERRFTAEVSRNKNLSAILKILEISNIHFSVEGRKLIVKP